MCSPGIIFAALHFVRVEPFLLLSLIPALGVACFGKDETAPPLVRLREAFSLSQQKLREQKEKLARYSHILSAAQLMSTQMDEAGLEKALKKSLTLCGVESGQLSQTAEPGRSVVSLGENKLLVLEDGVAEREYTVAKILGRIYQDCRKKVELHTHVLEALEETRRSQAQTLATSRLAAVGRLAAGVAHEVNTPMGAIVLAADLGERYVDKNPDKAREKFESIRDSSREVEKSVKRLLQYCQPDRYEDRTWFPVSEALEDSTSLLSFHQARNKVDLQIDWPQNVEFYGRKYDFHLLLSNLILNAFQACAETKQARVICRGKVQEDGSFLLEVVDNGPGVPPDNVPKLFEPFFTTKSSGEGTGLGLFLAAQAAESFTAAIRYRGGYPTSGAVFQVRFPQESFRVGSEAGDLG
jgi:C4-dicarboxylate-specific signal transduction histidine kinase